MHGTSKINAEVPIGGVSRLAVVNFIGERFPVEYEIGGEQATSLRPVVTVHSWGRLDRDTSLRSDRPLPPSTFIDQRAAKQQAQEEERRVRLERLRSDNHEEVEKIRTDAAESLTKAEQAWETERGAMERELTEKVNLAFRLDSERWIAITSKESSA